MKEIEDACLTVVNEYKKNCSQEGKTVLSLKAICAIYQRIVRQVCTQEEDTDLDIIKEKIIERGMILMQHSVSAKNRIAQNAKALLKDGMVSLKFK